ncbi:hypothetical protein Pmani_007849 [Petrolisthes manimaculis]|uniref:Uncharacterized protein n=1 Tax=Petrolisthes manimaculis TaxID=1843537 RepID=A0AAE1Q7R0_9EUCA|nr:hypothetical protein Pmani_007849 [Petrolisthes manimaculis]
MNESDRGDEHEEEEEEEEDKEEEEEDKEEEEEEEEEDKEEEEEEEEEGNNNLKGCWEGIILACWAAGTLVGCLPVMGWAETQHGACLFTEVMNYDYLVFLYFCTIVGPGILMAVFYTHIYTVVLKQV